MPSHYVESDELKQPSWLAIRKILLESWDPIGVNADDWPADEYDSYIPKAKALIRSGASEQIMMEYLDWIATERMGFTSQPERGRPAARLLLALRPTLEPL
jgi:hypothetical protein